MVIGLWKKCMYVFEKDLVPCTMCGRRHTVIKADWSSEHCQQARADYFKQLPCFAHLMSWTVLFYQYVRNQSNLLEKNLFLIVLLFISVNHESKSQPSIFELWNLVQTIADRKINEHLTKFCDLKMIPAP